MYVSFIKKRNKLSKADKNFDETLVVEYSVYFSKSYPNPVSLSEASVLQLLKCVKLPLAIWFLKRSSLGKNAFKIANISEIRFSLPCNFTFKIFRCSVMSIKKASSRRHLGSTIKSTSSFFLSLSEIHLFSCEVEKNVSKPFLC